MLRAIGSKLVIALLLLAMFRLFFPFEMPFCRNVKLSRIFSGIISKIVHPYFYLGKVEISIWFCLQCVWVGGIVVSLRNLFREYKHIHRHVLRYGRDVSAKEPYRSVFQDVCSRREADMPILLVPGLDAPRQDRILHPRILLPEEMIFSEAQLRYVFRHELAHVRHHDALIKLLVNLLAAVYWWNPLMRILRRELDVILEIHIDSMVLSGGDKNARSDYVDTLMDVAAQALLIAQNASNGQVSSNPMVFGGMGDLEGRLTMIYEERRRISLPLVLLLLTMTLSLYTLSYAFILEAYARPSATDWPANIPGADPQALEQDMFAVATDDGGYDIYWNNVLMEHADSLEHYSGIPVTER